MTEEEIKALQEEKEKLAAENEQLKEEQKHQKGLAEQVKELKEQQEKKLEELAEKNAKEQAELKDVIKQLVDGEKAPEPEPTIADKINSHRKQNRFI